MTPLRKKLNEALPKIYEMLSTHYDQAANAGALDSYLMEIEDRMQDVNTLLHLLTMQDLLNDVGRLGDPELGRAVPFRGIKDPYIALLGLDNEEVFWEGYSRQKFNPIADNNVVFPEARSPSSTTIHAFGISDGPDGPILRVYPVHAKGLTRGDIYQLIFPRRANFPGRDTFST